MSENDSENPTPEDNSIPPSPQEPTEPAFENTAHSEPTEASQGPKEAQGEVFEPKVESEHVPENQENDQNQAKSDQTPQTEENSTPEPETAQIPVNEPLEESKPEAKIPEPEPEKEKPRISYLKSQKAKELLVMARNAIQFRKRKKLDKVMSLFLQHSKITNDEVEKFLHVSDATATRYLSQLEKEGKIKQNGKTGKGVSYSRIS